MDLLLQAERDRALVILANVGPSGCPKWTLLNVHGFTARTLESLMHDGLAADVSGVVAQIQITDAGRKASRRNCRREVCRLRRRYPAPTPALAMKGDRNGPGPRALTGERDARQHQRSGCGWSSPLRSLAPHPDCITAGCNGYGRRLA